MRERCGFYKKLVPDGKRIDIGDSKYIPVCSDCYNRIENQSVPAAKTKSLAQAQNIAESAAISL